MDNTFNSRQPGRAPGVLKSAAPYPRSPVTCYRRGFTLIELLIVIAVIAILAAILFPAFARAREGARRSVCLSNMKQIGLGMMQYVQDFDETFPRQAGNVYNFNSVLTPDPQTGYYANAGTANSTDAAAAKALGSANFLYAVQQYINSTGVFVCPSAGTPPASAWCPSGAGSANCWNATKANTTSYVINGVIVRSASPAALQLPLRLASLPKPAEVAVLQEFAWKLNGATNRPRWNADSKYELWHAYGSFDGVTSSESCSNQHFEGGSLLFSDGHAKWRKFAGLTDKDFGLTCPSPKDVYNTTNASGTGGCDANFTAP